MSDLNPSPEFEEKVRKAVEVPNANPEFVNKLRNELAGRPAKMKPRFILKPAWVFAFVLVAIALIASAPAAVNALKKLFGYVPGVGLVDNSGGMRTLAEPASVTRDGVTLTVTQALVYADHVQLVYEVKGANVVMDAVPGSGLCGDNSPTNDFWKDSDAELRLPDGTVVRRDYFGEYQAENTFAMKPVYAVEVPSDVMELSMLLKCLPFTKLGEAPENWEVPLKLKYVPAGTAIGEPVLDVTPSALSTASNQGITATLSKVVVNDNVYSFFVQTSYEDTSKPMTQLMPQFAYLIDSTGQEVGLNPWVTLPSILEQQDPSEPWEMQTTSQPAYGPYTLVIENIAGQDGHWELHWTSPDQNGMDLLDAANAIASQPNGLGVTAELKRVVKLDEGYLFYVHMSSSEQQTGFRAIEPVDVSVTDSTGKVIQLNLDGPQIYNALADNLWQFSTTEQVAVGPLKLVVDKAKVYYSNFNFETPPPDDVYQQIVKEHSFIFDVGADPQVGQEWTLNQEFETGGYHGIVKSVRAVTVDSKLLPFPELQPDASINRGYEFTVESVDPSIQWNVNLFVSKPEGDSEFADCIGGMDGGADSVTTHIVSCRGLSSGNLQVKISEISIWMNEAWEVDWVMPGQ